MRTGHFLRGPVPLNWLAHAARLSGRAFQVGVLLWYRAGLTINNVIRLPRGLLESFGITRDAKARAVRALEGAGLVEVTRSPGRAAEITLICRPSVIGRK